MKTDNDREIQEMHNSLKSHWKINKTPWILILISVILIIKMFYMLVTGEKGIAGQLYLVFGFLFACLGIWTLKDTDKSKNETDH